MNLNKKLFRLKNLLFLFCQVRSDAIEKSAALVFKESKCQF